MLEHLKRCAESKIKVHGGDFYGRVEGRALIFCENTKITTSYWTTTNRRMLEPTKKRYPTSKDKEKALVNGRRGTIMTKSNSILARCDSQAKEQ